MPQIFCKKLKKKSEALTKPPYPGPLGERILTEISEEAWHAWLKRQTILLNEYRLNPLDAEAMTFLEKEMETFLFTDDSEAIPGHIPVEDTQAQKENE